LVEVTNVLVSEIRQFHEHSMAVNSRWI